MANFFTDRVVQHPGRYRLGATGDSDVFDLTREEGTIYTQGTPLNAENLNSAMQDVIDQIPTNYVDETDFEADIDTTAEVGTTDGDLYAAITTLGWASAVVSGAKLFVKKLLTKVLVHVTEVWFTGERTSTGYGFAANQSRPGLTRSYTQKTGYTAIVTQAYCTSHAGVDVIYAHANNGVITFWAVNRTSTVLTNVDFMFRLLYLKDALGGGNITQ